MLAPAAALLTAIIAAIPFACTQWTNLHNRHSHTQIGFAGADTDHVYAHLWNTGRSASTVRNYTLKLGDINLQDVPLVPVRDYAHEVRSLIPAGSEVTVVLQVLGLETVQGKKYSDVMDAMYDTRKVVTLEAAVDESYCPGEKECPGRRAESFGAVLLRPLVSKQLPHP